VTLQIGGDYNYKCPSCGNEFNYWGGKKVLDGALTQKACPFCGHVKCGFGGHLW